LCRNVGEDICPAKSPVTFKKKKIALLVSELTAAGNEVAYTIKTDETFER
jgi:hypothetical protein